MLKRGGVERMRAGEKIFVEGNYCCASIPRDTVYLYKWSLFKVGGGHTKNGTAKNGVQIALEGCTTSDLFDRDKFRTAPIESRIEKCKVRTVDGTNILLMGAIDEQNTYENGFPFQVINLFLTGFPFNWNHVINKCRGQLSLNVSVWPASKDEYAWQEKVESLNSHYSGIHTKDRGTNISSFIEVEEKIYKVEENTSTITSTESLVRGSKRGRYSSQPIQSSKRLKCGNLSIASKQKVLTPSVGLLENSNIFKEFVSNLSSSIRTLSVERKYMTPEKMHSCKETYENFDRDDHLTESGSNLLRKKSLKVSVSQEDKDSVERKKNAVKYNILRSIKEIRESKKHIHGGSFLDEAKLTQSMCSITKQSGGENQTNGNFDTAGDSVYQRIDKNETEESPTENVHLRQMKNNCTSGGQQIQKIQKPVSEFPDTGCKTGTLISLDKSQTKRTRMSKSSQASRGELCGEIMEETVKKLSNVTHLEEITSIGEECKNYNLFPSDPEFVLIPNEIISPGKDGKGQIEVDCLTDVADFEFICVKEDISSASVENKPTSLLENHQNNDVNKSVKQVNNSNKKKRGSSRIRTRHTDQSRKLSETSVCTTVNDGVMLKCNDIDGTCGTNPHQGASEIEHGRTSKNCTEIGDNCREGNGDGEKDNIQTPKTSTGINMQTPTNRRQSVNNILSPRQRRVHTTPEEVSKAFGLKTSRSGRLLVPPLAYWCNQTIAYDMDGGIIAILDASSQRDEGSGRLLFTPPKQKDAIQMQKKLCNAANENILNVRCAKKASND